MGLLKSSEITKTFIDLDEALAGRKESTIMDLKMHIKELSFKDKESIFLASDFQMIYILYEKVL